MNAPNVVWITLESVRADHTSLHGYDRETTPNLQRIADSPDATTLENCFSPGIWTLPVTASLFTGTYPQYHRATETRSIPPETPTLAELLSDAGYDTCCISPNPHISSGTDLDRGFDTFSWLSSKTIWKEAGPKTILKFLFNLRRHSAGFETEPVKHHTSYIMNEIATRWLDGVAETDDPFFLYAHYGDPHHPYYPPEPYRDRFADGFPDGVTTGDAMKQSFDTDQRLHETIATDAVDDELLSILEALYDAEIAYTDEMVGRLYDYVQEHTDDTIFIVTADHGELFGEYGLLSHRLVAHDALTHVPAVIDGLSGISDQRDELVQTLDFTRTLAELADVETDHMHGTDLRNECREGAVVQRSGEIAEKHLADFRSYAPNYENEYVFTGDLTAYRTHNWKHVTATGADNSFLFNLPDETTDVSSKHPDVVERHHQATEAWQSRIGRSENEKRGEYSDAMQEQLADLGYLSD